MDNADCKVAVLRRVIALDDIGKHLTIPALVQQMIEDGANVGEGAALECAVRDLNRAGLLRCHKGYVHPTPAGFRARGEIQAGSLAANASNHRIWDGKVETING